MRVQSQAKRNFFSVTITALLLLATLAAGARTARLQQRRPGAQSPAAPSTAANSKRLALVIGNNAYETAPLKNPVNDARAVAQSLRERDFDVTARENVTLNGVIVPRLEPDGQLTYLHWNRFQCR